MRTDTFDLFQTDALAEGFDEALERLWRANQVVEVHAHPFAAKACVVAGEMWLTVGSDSRRLGPGDWFELAPHELHSERYGPEGATYWVARRNA